MGKVKAFSYKCLNCNREFFIEDTSTNDEGDPCCPYCSSDAIDPYSGEL